MLTTLTIFQRIYHLTKNHPHIKIMKIKEISIGAIQNGRKCSSECVITTNHITGNVIDKIFVCEAGSTKYFRTISITKSEDLFYEIGYYPHLLKKRSLEEIEELLLKEELVEATNEQAERAKEESSWL